MTARKEREQARKERYVHCVAKLRQDLCGLLHHLPATAKPKFTGSIAYEIRTSNTYFVPLGEYRSGIPVVSPVERSLARRDRLYSTYGDGNSYWGTELVEIVEPGVMTDFRPTMRTWGIMVTVAWVWDKHQTRKETVTQTFVIGGHKIQETELIERKGAWVVQFFFNPAATPIKAGVTWVRLGQLLE